MNRMLRALWGTALVASTVTTLCAQAFPQRTLDVQLKFDGTVARAHWVNGYLPEFSRAVNGMRPKVWMEDRAGRVTIPETEITFPEGLHVDIWDVTADRSGYLYAGIEASSPEGNGAGAICRVAPGGKDILVIRTEDFRPGETRGH
jgi:hypothetical protein